MSNDITALALLVSKAKASVFTLEYISQFEPADIDSDDIDLRFEVDGVETGTNASIVDECGQAAQMITALVEALEHYKSREERVTKLVLDNSVSWEELFKQLEEAKQRNTELVEALEKAQSTIIGLQQKCEIDPRTHEIIDLEERIAELESRTVTVKLPLPRRKTAADYVDDTFEPCDLAAIYNACRLECEVKFKNALAAAGIKVIEGEGE